MSTLASCVKITNAADTVGLKVPLIATCIAVGCKLIPLALAPTACNLNTPGLSVWLMCACAYVFI